MQWLSSLWFQTLACGHSDFSPSAAKQSLSHGLNYDTTSQITGLASVFMLNRLCFRARGLKCSSSLAQRVHKPVLVLFFYCVTHYPFILHKVCRVYLRIIWKRDRKRMKKFLQGSGMARVPNSDTMMRLRSLLAL